MRARNIKPGFFRNEHIADLPHAARLLFIGLWCMADKRGMLENRPRRIAAEIFPYEPETAITVNSLLDHCERLGFIRYLTDGSQEYIHIPTFLRHQSPHHTEKDSGLPAPEKCTVLPKIPNHGDVTVIPPLDHVRNPPDSLIPDSLIPDSLSAPDGADVPVDGDPVGAVDEPPPPKYTDLDMERAERLRAKIDQIDPRYFAGKRKPNLPSWADVFRLIRTVDGRTDEEIEIILTRLHEAPFWKGQVRSAEALRGTTSTGQYRFDAILRDITSSRTNGTPHAATGKRNYCPTPESDLARRKALGIA